jgi:hypothetical protein
VVCATWAGVEEEEVVVLASGPRVGVEEEEAGARVALAGMDVTVSHSFWTLQSRRIPCPSWSITVGTSEEFEVEDEAEVVVVVVRRRMESLFHAVEVLWSATRWRVNRGRRVMRSVRV